MGQKVTHVNEVRKFWGYKTKQQEQAEQELYLGIESELGVLTYVRIDNPPYRQYQVVGDVWYIEQTWVKEEDVDSK